MKHLILLLLAVVLSNCDGAHTRTVYVDQNGNTVDESYAQPPVYTAPVVIHESHSDGSCFVAGALIGHALSSGGGYSNGGYSSKKTKKTTIINNTYHAPAPTRRVGSTRSGYSGGSSYSAPKSSYRSSTSMSSRSRRR